MVGSHLDVTAEHREREETERLKLLLERTNRTARVGGWEADLLTGVLWWSDVTREIHEVDPDFQPSIDQGFEFYAEGESRDAIREAFRQAVEEDLPYDLELELLTAAGRRIWVRTMGVPNFRNGRCVSVSGAFQDIDARRQADELLRSTTEELERYFESSLDLLCIGDLEGRFLRLNPQWTEVMGFPLEEIVGRPFRDFIHPDDIERSERALSSGREIRRFENRFRCKDGSYRWLEWRIRPLDGKLYSAARDITRRKQLEHELITARDAAEAASRAKSSFLATMSHEIRTPLNGILGSADLLCRGSLAEDQRELLQVITHSGELLVSTINNILDFSKIEAGQVELEQIDFDLAEEVSKVLDVVSSEARRKGLELESRIDPALPPRLRGDVTRLRQVLVNLLGNAVKFTARGSVRVECGPGDGAGMLRVRVRDSGIGIPAERLDSLFEPFVQADSSTTREYGGTGLGLAICHRLIRLMGGELEVESVAGEGSTFESRVPLATAENAPPAAAAKGVAEAPSPAGLGPRKLHILIAEDNLVNQKVIGMMLARLGIDRVSLANNGREALEKWREDPPDLILMDQQMPEMDGSAATVRIREEEAAAGRPRQIVVGLSAGAMREDREEALAAGMDDYLTKPINREALDACLRRWLPCAGGA